MRVSDLKGLLARAMAAMAMLVIAVGTVSAQSSVRPPAGGSVGGDMTVEQGPVGGNTPGGALGTVSDGEVWGQIRHGASGTIVNQTGAETVLIQSQGEDWRLLRLNYLIEYGKWIVPAVVALLALFFLVRGRIRIKGGRTGSVIPRFTLSERVVHWLTASLFIILGTTGLTLLFGRVALIPVIGADAYGLVASAAMQAHNLFGPIFLLAVLLLFVLFLRGNGFGLVDLLWLVKGGGLLGGHASSHRYNFGEKMWFWIATFCGIAISITGFAMLFPDQAEPVVASMSSLNLPGREVLQYSNLIHAAAALLFIAVGLGHIYIGTLGMEGALEGMTRGTVDENWAKEHHDLWYEDHKAGATRDAAMAEAKAAHGEV